MINGESRVNISYLCLQGAEFALTPGSRSSRRSRDTASCTRCPANLRRIGGLLYVVIIAVGMVGFVVRGELFESGDATVTAANIMASETLLRATLTVELLGYAVSVGVALILYMLLEPVHRPLALLTAFLTATANAIYGLNGLFQLAAVLLLGGAGTSDLGSEPAPVYLEAFDPPQRHALAYLVLPNRRNWLIAHWSIAA